MSRITKSMRSVIVTNKSSKCPIFPILPKNKQIQNLSRSYPKNTHYQKYDVSSLTYYMMNSKCDLKEPKNFLLQSYYLLSRSKGLLNPISIALMADQTDNQLDIRSIFLNFYTYSYRSRPSGDKFLLLNPTN